MIRRYFPLLFLLAFHLFLLAYLRFTAWPEMFSYPYLKNHGFLLYRDMVHPYPPILTLTLAYLYNAFGYKLWVLQWFSWGVILASTVCVWLLAKQTTKSDKSAFIAAAAYVSLQPFLDGNMMWFDIAIVPMVLLGTLFFLRKNFLWSGIFFAMGVFTKQTAGLFYITVLAYLIWHDRSRLLRRPLEKSAISFLFGPLIFGVPLLVRLWQENALTGFWNWVVWYPATQWSKFPGYVQMSLSRHQIVVLGLLFTALAVLLAKNLKTILQPNFVLLSILSGVGILAIYPRFSFFHFQIVLAFWAVLIGVLLPKNKFTAISAVAAAIFALVAINLIIALVIRADWGKEARFYGIEERILAQEISRTTRPEQKVFLQGLPSQYYVMSNRLPPKPWADNFSWYLEIPGVQEEILSRWSQNSPLYLVWRTPSLTESFLGKYAPEKIVNYLTENYTKEQELEKGVWVWRRNKE